MCLKKTHWWPKKSKEPIKVYKVLMVYEDLMTPYMSEKVKLNHPIKAKRHWLFSLLSDKIESEGVHAYTDKSYALAGCYPRHNEHLYEAVIPPNTYYWIGMYNEIAATKMIVKRKL